MTRKNKTCVRASRLDALVLVEALSIILNSFLVATHLKQGPFSIAAEVRLFTILTSSGDVLLTACSLCLCPSNHLDLAVCSLTNRCLVIGYHNQELDKTF
jgi:hypothetical protein